MADRLKDDDDTRLESLFRSAPVRDDGFSARIVSRVRRKLWVQRLSLPVAFVVGGALSIKPMLQLVSSIATLTGAIPDGISKLEHLPVGVMPQLSTIIMGAALLGILLMIGRMLEE
jgi:hypothetical protein